MSNRVRYAPSPTGKQHIGGLRTALFNYFFAKTTGGQFILRIEDTDRERYKDDALKDIFDTFEWLGIEWDEGPQKEGPYGPYFQSQRKELYIKFAETLVENNFAYYCYCSQERIDNIRESQVKEKSNIGYDRKCRNLSESEKDKLRSQNLIPVIRLKVPLEGKTHFHDELLGDIYRRNEDISSDPVILKSDGFPTYHLANVVDDHLMQISHILRSQEWIPSVPIHIIMYKALGWTPPKFCHLPLVMGKDGQKLSKRHGSTSIIEFREQGYLPEAIINYISLLGWSYDDKREFFSLKELEKLFVLEKLNKSSAVFDYKKLQWFNGVYIRKKTTCEIKNLIIPYLIKDNLVGDPPSLDEEEKLNEITLLVHERLKIISDISNLVRFLFKDVEVQDIDLLIPKKLTLDKTFEILQTNKELVMDFYSLSDEENENKFRDKANKLEIKLSDILLPLRVAITGTNISPPLFESLRILGKEKTIKRINQAISLLEKKKE